MRASIVLDDRLVEKACRLSGLKSKRAVVEEGLRILIRIKEEERVCGLSGKLHWDGDLKAMREGRRRRSLFTKKR